MFRIAFSSLRQRLLLLVAAALLPAAILAPVGLVLLAQQQHAQVGRSMTDTARALMSAVENELELSMASAETLAVSRHLATGDLKSFYEEMARVLPGRPSWQTIVLADTSGKALLNAVRPYGGAGAPVVERESYDAVLKTGGPVIGNLARGVEGRVLFAVRVPVMVDGQLRYVLSAIVKPEALLPVIGNQKLPSESVISIFDARGTVVARSRRHAELVGKPISPGLQELAARGLQAWGKNITLDEEPTYSAVVRSSINNWGVGVGVPRHSIDSPIWRSYLVLGAGILLSLALGALAAALVASHITRPIRGLREAAQSVGRGEQPPVVDQNIPEIREVAEALGAAAQARRLAEQAREQLLQREQHARASAEHANRTKDEFLAMLGHELRNPLAAIGNAVHLLEKRGTEDELSQRAHQIVGRQVEHLARLMDDLLDVGRVMTGKIALDRVPLDLAETVRLCIGTLEAAGRLAHHSLNVQAASVWVNADSNRIEQIVSNLITNAVKYTPHGRSITIAVVKENADVLLRVQDEGMGMEPELVPHVFDLFVQGRQAPDRAQGGLGIGLTLVRRLAELHGGSVSAHSEGPGKGSVFTVRLPALAPPVPSCVPSSVPAAAARESVARRVLIVEDNQDAREMMRLLLEAEGHSVHEAKDGPGAAQAALEAPYDVAFVDIGLPGFDGYEVARRIRASEYGADMPLIALTGYGQPDDKRRALEAGFDLHLVKPANGETLAGLLAELRPRKRKEPVHTPVRRVK
jgi:signal transduction histidine kinase/ActR/RegA family two-component response regulator